MHIGWESGSPEWRQARHASCNSDASVVAAAAGAQRGHLECGGALVQPRKHALTVGVGGALCDLQRMEAGKANGRGVGEPGRGIVSRTGRHWLTWRCSGRAACLQHPMGA